MSTGPQFPHEPGQVVGKVPRDQVKGSRLTPLEEQAIRAAGGDPETDLPDMTKTKFGQQMAQEIAGIRKRADNPEGTPPGMAAAPPITPPEPVDIGTLSPEHQEELRRAMQQFRNDQDAQQQGQVPEPISHIPGMSQAFQQSNMPQLEIEDDREQAPQELRATVAQQEPQPFNPLMTGPSAPKSTDPPTYQETVAPPETSPPVADEPELPPASTEDPQAGAKLEVTICPRCHHHVKEDVAEPTTKDKLSYIQAVLGMPAQRFVKEYELFGGRMVVVFRGLLATELDMIQHQLALDLRDERVVTSAEYNYTFENYKLAASIASFRRAGSAPAELPAIGQMQTEEPTPLPQLVEWMNTNLYPMDTVRRAIGQHWILFGQILDRLEAQAERPDFWKEIEQPIS